MARPTFQKRHFELIARHLRATAAPSPMIEAWADRLAATNAKFNRGRFIEWSTAPIDLDQEQDDANERNARALAEATAI